MVRPVRSGLRRAPLSLLTKQDFAFGHELPPKSGQFCGLSRAAIAKIRGGFRRYFYSVGATRRAHEALRLDDKVGALPSPNPAL